MLPFFCMAHPSWLIPSSLRVLGDSAVSLLKKALGTRQDIERRVSPASLIRRTRTARRADQFVLSYVASGRSGIMAPSAARHLLLPHHALARYE